MKSFNISLVALFWVVVLFIIIGIIIEAHPRNDMNLIWTSVSVLVVYCLSISFAHELSYTSFQKDYVLIIKTYTIRKIYYKDLKSISQEDIVTEHLNPKRMKSGSVIFKPEKGFNIQVVFHDIAMFHKVLDFIEFDLEMKVKNEENVRSYKRRKKQKQKEAKRREKKDSR